MAFLSGGAAPDKAVPEMKFDHELIMAVINEGHTDPVMDAARSPAPPAAPCCMRRAPAES